MNHVWELQRWARDENGKSFYISDIFSSRRKAIDYATEHIHRRTGSASVETLDTCTFVHGKHQTKPYVVDFASIRQRELNPSI